jgi:hypothetical protein
MFAIGQRERSRGKTKTSQKARRHSRESGNPCFLGASLETNGDSRFRGNDAVDLARVQERSPLQKVGRCPLVVALRRNPL